MSPLVSVIIPVYNVEKYLAECLESVCAQTYTNLEIIVVNDASPDHSATIIAEFAARDKRILSLTHECNRGLSAARNTGIAHAGGEFVMFVDSDDDIDKDYIATLLQVAQKYDVDIMLGACKSYYDGQRAGAFHDPYFTPNFRGQARRIGKVEIIDDLQKSLRYEPLLLLHSFPVTAHTKFFRRTILDDKLFPEGIVFEDNVAFTELLFRAHNIAFYHNPKSNYWYRQKRAGAITGFMDMNTSYSTDMIAVSDYVIRSFQKHAPDLIYYALEKNIYHIHDRIIHFSPEAPHYFATLEKLGAYLLQTIKRIDARDLDKTSQIAPIPVRYLYKHADTLTPAEAVIVCTRFYIENNALEKLGFAEIKTALKSWAQRKSGVSLNNHSIYAGWIAVLWNLFRFAIRKKMRRS